MNAQERLRQAIDQQQTRLLASVPPDRQVAILALIRTLDRTPCACVFEPLPDLFTGRHICNLGESKALQLVFESTSGGTTPASATSGDGPDGWAERFLELCRE